MKKEKEKKSKEETKRSTKKIVESRKVQEKVAEEIRELAKTGAYSVEDLAKRYGYYSTSIYRVISGERWGGSKINIREIRTKQKIAVSHTLMKLGVRLKDIADYLTTTVSSVSKLCVRNPEAYVDIPIRIRNNPIDLDGKQIRAGRYIVQQLGPDDVLITSRNDRPATHFAKIKQLIGNVEIDK
ncbi:hypothetical protein [Bythopirellula polymerisocia]|uniref:Uncharacterized protein n=1 Tax=Bythopirellula polymerisocia TaxID=2528003 RepID=A0A5C6C085_9BACT|nr:hypothetical protein [Bythopirellula polymerisocia]TWU17595.1 hypothetical protein Pla144_50970 [Bythopirellula polymerisocia]